MASSTRLKAPPHTPTSSSSLAAGDPSASDHPKIQSLPPAVAMSSPSPRSYWCYSCSRSVTPSALVCPDCDGGFLEEIHTPSPFPAAAHRRGITHRSPASSGGRSPFNPVIVLRGADDDTDRSAAGAFELYYDDGAGAGLRPLPASMSDFLMGSGFDRILDQLAQVDIGAGGAAACDRPPASKAAVESMPVVEIAARHVGADAHCAVCTDPFEVGTAAREMPCKHIYHPGCILPWLALRNSCPVCRHEMPTDTAAAAGEDAPGLTIWRLPGGGFAVGRFAGARRAGERELPVVYTEMDGGFNAGGVARRISWSPRGSRSREGTGIGRAVRNFFAFFGRRRRSSAAAARSGSDSAPASPRRSRRGERFGRATLTRTLSRAAPVPVWY